VVEILGEDDNGVFTLSNRKKDFFVNCFNNDKLNLKFTKLIEVAKHNNIKLSMEEVFFMKENVIVLASGFNKATSQAVTYAWRYNKRNGNVNGKIVAVSTVDVEKKRRKGYFGFKISQSGEFFMVYHYARLKKAEKQKLTIQVYDSELELLKEINKEFDFNERGRPVYGMSHFMVDDDANVFYVRSGGEGDEVGEVQLISYLFVDEYEERELPITIKQDDGRFSGVVGLTLIAEEENVYLAGYYVSLSGGVFKYVGIDGTFYAKIDIKNNSILTQSISPFDDEVKRKILSDKKVDKGRQLPASFRIKDIMLLDNGEVVIISEYFTVQSTESRGMKTTTYIYGSIIATKVNNEGEIEWNKAIIKKQMYTDVQPVIGIGGALTISAYVSVTKDKTIYYSYLVGVGEEELYFIFNDNEKNFGVPTDDYKKLSNPKKGIPAIVTINRETGDLDKIAGYEVLSNDVILRPRISKQVSPNEVLVYGSKKKSEKIGRLIFD